MIYLTDNHIIQGELVDRILTGTDLLTDELVVLNTFEHPCIKLPKSIISLIGNEKARYLIAKDVYSKNHFKLHSLLGIGERTLYSWKNKYKDNERQKVNQETETKD